MAEASGGSVHWLADGMPEMRRVGAGDRRQRHATGSACARNGAYRVTALEQEPLLPPWLALLLIVGSLLLAWGSKGDRARMRGQVRDRERSARDSRELRDRQISRPRAVRATGSSIARGGSGPTDSEARPASATGPESGSDPPAREISPVPAAGAKIPPLA